ncbi:MAG: endonuclease III [Coriobacteriaceae bacterium]|nr:endonuclease III [Coriobacteriaceae bacterium]
MPREAKAKKQERAVEVCRRMEELYPEAECALHFSGAFECVIAVSLSAQTTDANVNKVTPELFSRWPDPQTMAQADVGEVEEVIRSIGFYHNKARNCVSCAQTIMADFGGEVPDTMEDLQKLPGVGRKTANIVLNNIFDVVEGIAVDTHVFRLAHKLKLSNATTPSATEQDLLALIPQELWKPVNHQWILFGREYCDARRPRCDECPLVDLCPSAGK